MMHTPVSGGGLGGRWGFARTGFAEYERAGEEGQREDDGPVGDDHQQRGEITRVCSACPVAETEPFPITDDVNSIKKTEAIDGSAIPSGTWLIDRFRTENLKRVTHHFPGESCGR